MSKISMTSAAAIKRTAITIAPLIAKQEQLQNKITTIRENAEKKVAEIQQEIAVIEEQRNLFEEPIMKMTGGYKTSDLIAVTISENVKDGKVRKSTSYTFKYPDTILPPEETAEPTETEVPSDEVNPETPADELSFGNE